MPVNDNGTNVPLKEFILRILDERQAADHAKLEAEVRLSKIERIELERRLEGLNQLRSDVVKDRSLFVTRDIFEQHKEIANTQFAEIKRRWAILVGVGLVLVPIAGVIGAIFEHVIFK